MVCRVCKHELDGPVCSFCGEDNTPYMTKETKTENTITNEETKIKEPAAKKADKAKPSYKFNKKKLARTIMILALAVICVVLLFRAILPDNKNKISDSGNTLFTSGMLAVASNGEWGYVNIENPSIFAISPQFGHVTDYHDDRAAVLIDGKFSIIDKEGNLICEPCFESVGSFSQNGLIAVKQDGRWGYIDKDADFVIDPKFATAYEFAPNSMAAVSVSGSYGYIGTDGEYTIAPQYDMAFSFSADGLAAVKTSGKWGYIDASGNAVIEPKFEEAYSFENGHAVVKQNGDYGLIDADGRFVISPQFDERFCFESERAIVKVGNKYGYIGLDGKYIINPSFSKLGSFGNDGLAFAAQGSGKCGFINTEGDFVINASYEDALNFNLGLAPVKEDGLWGYVDKDGNEVIDTKFLFASEFFDDGYAYVKGVDGSVMIIDTQGKMAVLEAASAINKVLK